MNIPLDKKIDILVRLLKKQEVIRNNETEVSLRSILTDREETVDRLIKLYSKNI